MTTAVAALSPVQTASLPGAASAGDASTDDDGFSFHDLLSIVNPLQHVPVVSTLYRAVTGDTIKPLERIAGDTLYGGVWGFVSSVANVAFQEITGKDFGDTALAMLEGEDSGTPASDVASNAPVGDSAVSVASADLASGATTLAEAGTAAATTLASTAATPAASVSPSYVATAAPARLQSPAVAATANAAAGAALLAAMNQKGIDPTLGQRALNAYQKSLATRAAPMATSPAATPTS